MGRPLGYRWLNPELALQCACGKVRSKSKAEAKRRRRRAAKASGHENAVRYYRCSYGSWHWTSMIEPPDLTRFDGDAKVGDNTNNTT